MTEQMTGNDIKRFWNIWRKVKKDNNNVERISQ